VQKPAQLYARIKQAEAQPALLHKLVAALVHDAALAQMLEPLRAAIRSLVKEQEGDVRICPDCGMPATKSGDEWFGPWHDPDDDTKLKCTYCSWTGSWDEVESADPDAKED
jgi:hypothetical protein